MAWTTSIRRCEHMIIWLRFDKMKCFVLFCWTAHVHPQRRAGASFYAACVNLMSPSDQASFKGSLKSLSYANSNVSDFLFPNFPVLSSLLTEVGLDPSHLCRRLIRRGPNPLQQATLIDSNAQTAMHCLCPLGVSSEAPDTTGKTCLSPRLPPDA